MGHTKQAYHLLQPGPECASGSGGGGVPTHLLLGLSETFIPGPPARTQGFPEQFLGGLEAGIQFPAIRAYRKANREGPGKEPFRRDPPDLKGVPNFHLLLRPYRPGRLGFKVPPHKQGVCRPGLELTSRTLTRPAP